MIWLWAVLILAGSFLFGAILAWTTRDELLAGRPWFLLLAILSTILALIFLYFKNYTFTLTLLFITISSAISFFKSYDKIWIRKHK